MFSALFSFLGGTAFRMIWGELSSWITARQEHAHEVERMRLQADLDAATHGRNLESIRVQAELGIQTIRVQGDADSNRQEMEGWSGAVREALKPTGIWFVDVWNGVIRPLAATIALILWVGALNRQGWTMTPWDQELVGVVLGFFFASRELSKRGK